MIRLTALAVVVVCLCVYAVRDWFSALCGLILLTTLAQHPNLPHAMLGVSGLNPWNVVFFVILLAWLIRRRKNQQRPPDRILLGVGLYGVLLVIGGARAMVDVEEMIIRRVYPGSLGLFFDLIVNPMKYILVGIMFWDGCRTLRNVRLGIHTLLVLGLAHSLLMYKTMKESVFFGNYEDARRLAEKLIGLHAVDLSGLLTFALWAWLAYAAATKGWHRWVARAASLVILPTVVGCYSRAAFISNVVLALVFGALRWRRLLVAAPAVLILVAAVFPHSVERILMDLNMDAVYREEATNWNKVTAGRTETLWEPVIAEIAESPIIGHGRLAILRGKCYDAILSQGGVVPSHPHNSYLELLLDYGITGAVCVLGLLVAVGWMSLQMLWSAPAGSCNLLVGSLGLLAVVNAMVLGVSSTFFYPKESSLWLICAIALTIRVWSWSSLPPPHGAAGPRSSAAPCSPYFDTGGGR